MAKESLDDLLGGGTTKKKASKKKASKKKTSKKVAKKAPAKKAAAKPEPTGEGRGRQPGEARGVPGVNMNQVLRETFARKSGATPGEAVAAVMEAVGNTKAAAGGKYTEDAALGRVRKFLQPMAKQGLIETLGVRKSGNYKDETIFRFTGEVAVSRGRAPASE